MTESSGSNGLGASNELLLEFLDSVMYRRFNTALILCRKIIEVEPDNYQARAFLPMLEDAHSMKSKGYFNPLEISSDSDTEQSSAELSEHRNERRGSSSSSEEWDYSTTSSDSDVISGNEGEEE